MTAQSQLEAYLGAFRKRLKVLIVARGAAILAAVALVVTLVAVYLGTRRAFDPEFVIGARTLLFLALAAGAAGLLVYPLRLLKRSRGIREIERRGPDFDGRIETYDTLQHHPEQRSPFLSLLAEDALKFARRVPVALRVPSREISVPAAIAFVLAGTLVWFAAFGPDNWRYGVRHLWAGWVFDNTLPPQRIAVTPGDGLVRRGGDVAIEASAEGFDPASMQVFARFDERGAWESAPMTRAAADEDAYEFTFFAVRQPLDYYVTAAGVRSQQYGIEIADLPEVRQISLNYQYPEWSGLEPRVEEPGSDIRAVAGTQVTVEVETDQPLGDATLVANGQPLEMQSEGNVSTATLEVDEQGEYFISTLFNDDEVKLTDDYFISVVPDDDPVVDVVRPGRDWRASNIEEVTVGVDATDDFGLQGLELRYAVNGGEWQTVALDSGAEESAGGEHILYLEDMRVPLRRPQASSRDSGSGGSLTLTLEDLRALRSGGSPAEGDEADGAEAEAEEPAPTDRGLEPGDLISYYAVAEDRRKSVQTDLFFIEVQPFDRSYSQSTQSGGGGGGGGGQQQDEISQRQKEILVATWNLINERDEEEASFLDERQLEDNAQMLAELQRTLADQARTLASRTRARELTGADERIEEFVTNLEQAAEAMGPASERLAELDLTDAVPSEQEALQFLLRAESVFTDIQVSFQQNGGGGGGGLAGRDLSELFELEMDLEKNQYETEDPVAFDTAEEQVDEAISKLQELARRQENLARRSQRRNQLTEQERWQQDMLRRETEELKRQLEEAQQRMAEQQQAQQDQQGQEGQQGEQQAQEGQQGQQQGQPGQQQGQPGQQQGQPGQQGQQQGGQMAGGNQQNTRTAEAIEQLDRALQAMNQAGEAGQEDIDPEQTRRAIEQARRQLQQALEGMTAERQAAASEAYSDLAERSRDLYEGQRQSSADLQRALSEAIDNQIDDRSLRGGLSREDAQELGQRKYELQQELEALEEDIQRVAQQFRNQTPGASEELSNALADLQEAQAVARLRVSADGILRGAAPQVAATDAVTTSALRDLQRRTDQALDLATREAVAGEQTEADPSEELVAELQTLRRQMAELTRSQQNAEQGQQGQQGGQPGQGQQQAGGGQPGGGERFGGGGGGFYDPTQSGVWDAANSGFWRDPEAVEQLSEQLNEAGGSLMTLGNRLRAEGLSEEELRAVRELGDALREGLTGNPELVEREYQAMVDLVEQLELRLRDEGDAQGAAVRTEAPVQVAQGFEEVVAEYFRRLSRSNEEAR